MNLAQGETFHPAFVAQSPYTGVTMAIIRPRDGAAWDWAGGAFQAGTREQVLTQQDATAAVWGLAAGWTVPVGAFDSYLVVYTATDAGGTSVFEGERIPKTHARIASVNDASATATTFVTTLTETVTDHWKDALVKFDTGVLAGQVKQVTGYNGTTKAVTIGAFTSAPANGDVFRVVNF